MGILEEISSFDNSIDRDADNLSSTSEDEKNCDTLKHMLNDMKDFIGTFSHNTSTGIDEEYEGNSYSNFFNNKSFDEINDYDFSMKGFQPIYSGVEQSDLYEKNLGQGLDTLNYC